MQIRLFRSGRPAREKMPDVLSATKRFKHRAVFGDLWDVALNGARTRTTGLIIALHLS